MNDVMARDQGQELTNYQDNPYTAYGAEADRSGLPLLRFNQGSWVCGGSNEELKPGTTILLHIDQLEIGWRKWWGQQIVDTVAGQLGDGYRPPKRDALGDDDQTTWEPGLDGRTPKDPWEFFNAMPAVFRPGASPIDTDEVLAVGTSKGFITAVGRVSKAYGERFRQHPGELPVVELHASSYYNKSYKRDVDIPEFKVVGWSSVDDWGGSPDAVPGPAVEPQGDSNHQQPATGESRRNF